LVWPQFAGPLGKIGILFVSTEKRINSPAEIICLVSSFISYRAGLQKAEDKTTLEMGVGALKDAALIFHLSVLGSVPPTLERFCFSKPLLR
jgi:hypothetical protein